MNLTDQIVLISKKAPASRNRFVYYPDHLVRIPGPQPGKSTLSILWEALVTLFREPLFKGVVRGVLKEPSVEARPDNRKDESVGHFMSRRFNPAIADNLVSAVFHGIYAGDIYKLSADTLIGLQRLLEAKHESVIIGALDNNREKRKIIPTDYLLAMCSIINQRPPGHFDRLRMLVRGASVFTIRDGLAEIARAFEKSFSENSAKIDVVTGAQIRDIKREQNHDITVRTNLV